MHLRSNQTSFVLLLNLLFSIPHFDCPFDEKTTIPHQQVATPNCFVNLIWHLPIS